VAPFVPAREAAEERVTENVRSAPVIKLSGWRNRRDRAGTIAAENRNRKKKRSRRMQLRPVEHCKVKQQNRHHAGRTTHSEKNGSRRVKAPLQQEGVMKEAMRPARVARAVHIEEATVPPVKMARVLPAGKAATEVNDARGATRRVAGQRVTGQRVTGKRGRTALAATAPNAEPMLPLPTETAADRNVRKRTNRQQKNRKRRSRESSPGSSDGRSNETASMTTC
jgi:hypothetical protein